MSKLINDLSAELPVLIAGPTASGKSALALEIAARQGGLIVNADALQVFENWQVLTARPGAEELLQAEHRLYGHVPSDHPYSVGEWLGEVRAILGGAKRPIIVGGTGLYFMALTEGLADIPATPGAVRETALARIEAEGHAALAAELDAETAAAIDLANPMRVQRAWEVLTATGRGLAEWQRQTPAPALPLDAAQPILIDADKDWLNGRIARRFDQMIEGGALDEARANLPGWRDDLASAKAIGAVELIAHLRGELSLPEAATRAKIATRQYAKRQRSWFRARMKDWPSLARPA